MSLTDEQGILRNQIAEAASFRTLHDDDGNVVRDPETDKPIRVQTGPKEQALHRTKFALVRRRRCDVPPVKPYRLDPALAKFMAGKGLVEILEKTPGEKAPEGERTLSGRNPAIHVHLLCELTDLGRAIAATF